MLSDEPTSTIEATDALLGRILEGRYRLDAMVASGAMGSVYAGTHLDLGKKVAIKVLHPWLAGDPRSCQRFLQEARAICSLSHPNVVAVDRCGIDGTCMYIAMEFLEGGTLADWIKRAGPLTPQQAVRVISEAAAGLAHAHTCGILHRDVKPSNIMFATADNTSVHVVDFGIAKFSQSDGVGHQKLTSSNGTVGTPYYMSPEQSSRDELDVRSDIYSLGCVLYEALTGNVPFRGDSAFSILLSHAQDQAPTLPKQVPVWLQGVVAKAMAKDRDQRYASMLEFRQALVDQKGAPDMVRRRKDISRRGVMILAACLAAAGGAAASFHYLTAQPEKGISPSQVKEAVQAENWPLVGELSDKYFSTAAGIGDDKFRMQAIRWLGGGAVGLIRQNKKAQAGELFEELKKLRDGASDSRAVQQTAWEYMADMISNELDLESLTLAREDARFFVDSTKQYNGVASLFYGRALSMMAEVEWKSQNMAEARKLFAESVRIAVPFAAHRGEETVLKEATLEQTLNHYYTVDPEAAEQVAKKVLAYHLNQNSMENLNHTSKEDRISPAGLVQGFYSLATIYAAEHKWQESRDALGKSVSLLKTMAGGNLKAEVQMTAIGNLMREQGGYEAALLIFADTEQQAKLLSPKDQAAFLSAARGGRIFALSRLKRFDERDKLLAQYLAEPADDTVRGLYSDMAAAMLAEGPDFLRGRRAVLDDIHWDLEHHAADVSMFDDFLRLSCVQLALNDRPAFADAVKMMDRYATTEVLQARSRSFKLAWGLVK